MNATSGEIGAEIILRDLSFGDLPAIMEIERKAFTIPWRPATFENLLDRPDTDLIGATRLGHLLGYAVTWTIGDQAELGNVAVKDTERARGVGRRLLEAALDRVAARGARECFLEVRESNKDARSLYEKAGFQVVGRRRHYYSRPIEDALVMRRDFL